LQRTSSPWAAIPTSDNPEFTRLLHEIYTRSGKSYEHVAAAACIDRAYAYRLVNGQQSRPSRECVIRLAIAFQLDVDHTDELLLAANYAPLYRERHFPPQSG
jgi:helix-turn-helix protein